MDTVATDNPRAVPGGNNPPAEPTPFEAAQKAVEDVYEECSLWLDGATVDSQAMADGIGNLVNAISAAWTIAEEARKAEKKPHDEAAKAVQAKFKPLIEKAERAKDACKKALAPWLQKRAAEIELAARLAREAAEAKRRTAEDALRASDAANLAEREAAEALLKDAKKADAVANRAERQTATAGGTFGRAMGLRTIYVPVITDPVALARFAWASHRAEMTEFLTGLVERLVRGGAREIPGCDIREEKRAV